MLAQVGMDTSVLKTMTLNTSDWLACIIYLAVTLGIAIYAKYGQKDITDYFLAGHKMPWIPTHKKAIGPICHGCRENR